MPKFETDYKVVKSSAQIMRNLLDPHETMHSCVQKIRIHFLENETNSGSVGVLQNLEPFYKTIIGLVHDVQNHKAL